MYRTFFKIILLTIISSLVFLPLKSADISSDDAIKKLKTGNLRYIKNQSIYPNLSFKRRQFTVKKGQHPFATIITCSDSRIPLEHVFDVGVGDIFVIRVAGNVIAIDEAGSIEYGVEHLNTPVFIVLGHTGCGAVTAVVKNAKVHGNIPQLVDNIIPAVKKAQKLHGTIFSDNLLTASIENNVWQSIEDLYKTSHTSLNLVKEKKLKVIGAVYNLEKGTIKWLGQHPNENELLDKYSSAFHLYFSKYLTFGFLVGILLVIVSLILFIFLNKILFKEETRNKKYQIMTRINWGYYGVLIAGLLSITASFLFFSKIIISSIVQLGFLLLSFITLSLIFIRKYSTSIEGSFKSVISKLKNLIKE